ncbi:MAG: 7-carboxy-7-deazaguanine synthase [Alphaproteobacteria bacterium]|jgi:7-carboxy-7-deazaguanine synthase
MAYMVKEMYLTLQGEGAQAGRAALFCRFSGCNLWSGREKDRLSAQCQFCDTDFVGTDGPGGSQFEDAASLVAAATALWAKDSDGEAPGYVVCTGGEPLLQLDKALVDAFHGAGFSIAIETNGTLAAPDGIDWICVSPKAGTDLVLTTGNELKLVYPQTGAAPELYSDLDFDHFFLQPMDCPERDQNTKKVIEYCLAHPRWRLSLQIHKTLGLA